MPGRTTHVSASTQDRESLVVLPKKRIQIAAGAVCIRAAQAGVFQLDNRIYNQPYIDVCE
jgi:hypothetical protein